MTTKRAVPRKRSETEVPVVPQIPLEWQLIMALLLNGQRPMMPEFDS